MRLSTHTGETLCELHQVRFRRGTVLRKHIHRRTYREHRLLCAQQLLHTEDVGDFGDGLCRTFAKVNKSHRQDISGLHISLNILHRSLSQSSCLLSELVQLVTPSTCVHLLERLVESFHLFRSHLGVFASVRHLLLHLCKGVHGSSARHHDSRQQRSSHKD